MVIGVNRFYISDIHIDYGTRIALGPMLPHAVTRKPGESPHGPARDARYFRVRGVQYR